MLKSLKMLGALFLASSNLLALDPCPSGELRQPIQVCSEQYNLSLDALDTLEVVVLGDWPAVSCSVKDERLQVSYIVGTATITPPTTPALYGESCKVENGVAVIKYRFPNQRESLFDRIFTKPVIFIAGMVVGSLVTVGIMK